MGHLFVVQADLTKLVVSDAIVPCDPNLNFHEGFTALLATTRPGTYTSSRATYRQPSQAVAVSPGLWRAKGHRQVSTRVWLLDSSTGTGPGTGSTDSLPDLMARISAAIQSIATSAHDEATIGDQNRPEVSPRRPSIGLTLMGIKEGGYEDQYAAVIGTTIETFEGICGRLDVDIVLSLLDRADYAAVQNLRRDRLVDANWSDAEAEAKRLARLAAQGNLVLFIGAGASVDAGLDDWKGLLLHLAETTGLELTDRQAFFELDPRDQALLIGSGPNAREADLRQQIARAFQSDRYPLTQALLASLRVDQALTTNYDVLYETAFGAGTSTADRRLQVLPRETLRSGWPWLMKIHGDATVPETIVISRDDYIRFDVESIPMASVLQSAMLTSHILFVGYSVTDENVVRLARQVVNFRQRHRPIASDTPATGGSTTVTPAHPGASVGTVLVPSVNDYKRRLWDGVLGYVPLPIGSDEPGRDQWSEATRNVAIFLDLLGMHACQDAPYFLVDRYEELLDKSKDLPVKAALLQLQKALAGQDPSSPVAVELTRMLTELGSPPRPEPNDTSRLEQSSAMPLARPAEVTR